MTTASAAFEFSTDGGSTWKPSDTPLTGANALAASGSPIVLKARLTSLAGVHTLVPSVTTADDATIEGAFAGVSVAQASDKTVTLTIPGTAGRAYVLEFLVNPDKPERRRLAVHVKTTNGYEVLAAGEYDEASRVYGWTKAINDAIRGIGAGGGGGASPYLSTPAAVAAAGSAGAASEYARGDHVHAGVTSVNGSQGAVVLAIPTAGAAPPDVAAAGAAGAAATFSRSDHTHAGVTSYNGAGGAVTGVSTVAGATPSAGAIAITTGGTTGLAHSVVGNGITFRLGVTSQAAGDLVVATGATTWARHALGAADTLLGVNGAGAALANTDTPWLSGGRFGMGGSAAGVAFGTAPLQAQGDATNGQAVGIRSDATLNKGLLSFFDDAGAQKADLESADGSGHLTLRARGLGLRLSTAADDSKVPIHLDAGSNNVWLGSSATPDHNGGEGVLTLAQASATPSALAATDAHLLNSAGTIRAQSGTGFSSFVGVTERFKVIAGVVAVNTNFSLGSLTGSFGGGANVAFFVNATVPTSNPTGGGILYGEAGGLKFRGSAGSVTSLAPA